MKPLPFDVVRDVLDHEIVDASGVACGMVDDVDLAFEPGKAAQVVALLVGPGASQRRLPAPIAALAGRIFGRGEHRIEWRHVARIAERVELDCPAVEVGLGAADRRWSRRLERIPGAS